MIIDAFTHFLPPAYLEAVLGMEDVSPGHRAMAERFKSIRALVNLEDRLALMRRWPEVRQILSLAIPTPEMVASPSEGWNRPDGILVRKRASGSSLPMPSTES